MVGGSVEGVKREFLWRSRWMRGDDGGGWEVMVGDDGGGWVKKFFLLKCKRKFWKMVKKYVGCLTRSPPCPVFEPLSPENPLLAWLLPYSCIFYTTQYPQNPRPVCVSALLLSAFPRYAYIIAMHAI